MADNLPLYNLTVDENDNSFWLTANSFVEQPAHNLKYMVFNKQKQVKHVFNDEQKIVMGVAIATDVPIYRRDEDGREYFVQFDEANTKKIAQKALKSGAINILNLDHDGQPREGAYLYQSIIVDSKIGISAPDAFADQNLKDGSWIVGYKVEDERLWDEIKKRKGFSVEVFVNEQLVNNTKIKKMKQSENKGLSAKFATLWKEVFGEEPEQPKQFESAVTSDGVEVMWEGELAEGVVMLTNTEEGEVIVPEGVYLLPDAEGNYSISVTVAAEGVVSAIEQVEVEEEMTDDLQDFQNVMRPILDAIKAQGEAIANLKGDFESMKNDFNAQNGKKKFGSKDFQKKGDDRPSWRIRK